MRMMFKVYGKQLTFWKPFNRGPFQMSTNWYSLPSSKHVRGLMSYVHLCVIFVCSFTIPFISLWCTANHDIHFVKVGCLVNSKGHCGTSVY